MIGAMNRLEIEVDKLRKGMYVAEPDRPWTEIPLPFAGFTIRTDEELETLRKYCKHVYVDPERCAASEREILLTGAQSSATSESGSVRGTAARSRSDDGIDDTRREIDTNKLSRQVEAASRTIASTRTFLKEAFSDADRGKGVDTAGAKSTIEEMIVRLTKNPVASLLLTSLNDRDEFTSLHSVHVCILTLAFWIQAGADKQKLEILGLGALLHDIGKARLPTALLNRAGPLNKAEWRIAKYHPVEGHRILTDSGNIPEPALDICLMHHERRDGQGYPDGLTKEELPDYVRVTALANRYESLTSTRPYREAAAADKVLRSFYDNAEKLYGRRPVEAFIRCVGIYPVGSLVELDNGALAVVIASRPNMRLRPAVQMVRTPDGEPYDKLVLLNLAAEAEKWEKREGASMARQIKRVCNPKETGIDPGAIIAESFGVQI